MKYFLLFFITFTLKGLGQITVVDYQLSTNFGLPITTNWVLVFNENESYFYKEYSKIKTDNNDKNMFSLKNANNKKEVNNINVKVDFRRFYKAEFEKDSLFSQIGIVEKPYYVHEQIPKLDWEILKEKKTIKDYTCQKAKTHFRGRTYYVWFTTEIPTQAGPWKFNGLPGLILRVENSTSTILMKATKIQKKPDTTLEALITQIDFLQPKGERLSLKEFIPLKDNEFIEMIKKQSAHRNSRNTTTVISKPAERQGFEKVYEWEEEEKGN